MVSERSRLFVGPLSQKWNSFFDNLLIVHQKIQELGFHYYYERIVFLDKKGVSK